MPFEIYDDFESVLKRVQKTHRDGNASYTEKYQEHILCSFPCKIVCTDDRFSKSTSAVYRFIGEILSKYGYCKKVFKKHFIKARDDCGWWEQLESSNKCWICNKLHGEVDNKVIDHDHMTGKYSGSAHKNCNINLRLTKKISCDFL